MIQPRLFKHLAHIVRSIAVVAALLLPVVATAQTDTIRYVKTTGAYTNNGRSWASAKNDVQDAINDLYQYLRDNHLTSGSIYIAAGTYKPSESSESDGGGLQFTAFKIYPGIHIYGGFAADETDDNANPFETEERTVGTNTFTDYKYRPHNTLPDLEQGGNITQTGKLQPYNFVNETILSGSHNAEPTFTYDKAKGTFSTVFPGNSYHVVWFATEGFIEATSGGSGENSWDETSLVGHALPLSAPASIDGCIIRGGYAATKTTETRNHTSYGGGAYLVEGATLSRCIIDHCVATLRGGGVYLDGGGLVDLCKIHTCQATGVGIMQGYGGAVCIDYDGAVTRTYIVNNSSRLGGGVAICHAPDEYPWHSLDKWRTDNGGTARGEINVYSPHATACIVSNNTSTAEAGGVYLYDGGVVNHLTITHNNCVGPDVSYYGRRHGRSGGIYILNGGQMYNSVVWGNKCAANNDIQYAAHTSGSTATLTPRLFFSAIDNHDITDWVGTFKSNVFSLEKTNTNVAQNNANYPYFIGSDGRGKMMGHTGAGLNLELPQGTVDPDYDETDPTSVPDPDKTGIPRPIYWKPAAITSLASKGVQVTDALAGDITWIQHAHTDTDIFGDTYEPISSLGALTRREEQFGAAMVTNQEKELYADKGYTQAKIDIYNSAVVTDTQDHTVILPTQLPDDGSTSTLPTIFVDPSRNAGKSGISIGEQNVGTTWDKPVGHINDAIFYFRHRQITSGPHKDWYNIGGTDNGDGTFTGGTDYEYVQILVKGGPEGSPYVANTAGRGAYLGNQLRTASIRPCSNMRIYGGYDPDATGTNTSNRDQQEHATRITADVTNSGYANNTAHVFALINVHDVIIDGFRIHAGNANLDHNASYAPIDPITGNPEPITFGGGLILNNASVAPADRIDMTGNILRNSDIANCSAPEGAAIYVNSEYTNPSTSDVCKAELNIINTIIRNNTIGNGTDHDATYTGYGNAGIITAHGKNAKIRLDHCDIVNNCGYALETTPTDGTNATEGIIRIYNSVIYANGKIDRANRSKIEQPLSCRSSTNGLVNIDGDYIFLDWDAPKLQNSPHSHAVLCRDFSDQYGKWGIRKIDMYQQTVKEGGVLQIKVYPTETAAQAEFTSLGGETAGWTTPIYLDYPYFTNPSRNVGHSEEGDKPMNGGVVDYTPENMNPIVNAAVDASTDLWDNHNNNRTFGGDPDVGAIEDSNLPQAGTVLYVTPEGAGRRDGSSWKNAIAGNTVYALNGAGAAAGDQLDNANSTTRIINATTSAPVLTTDSRYCGGFATSRFTSLKTGGDATTTTTTVFTTERNEYYRNNVKQDAETEILQDNVRTVETKTTTVGATETTGVQQDPRFPYGELSGHSRTFWRANPYTGKYGIADSVTFINDVRNNGWICNTRTENYVSGLQYAVETASVYNNLPANDPARITGIDSVQVWVGNGTYSDYKGYVMRSHVTVMGGFPTTAYGTPGSAERQALMSAVVNIPKAAQAKDYDPEDYETILQISDVNPEGNGHQFNNAAVNAWDDDLELIMPSNTYLATNTVNRTIVHRYDWTTTAENNVTSTYYQHSSFYDDQISSETTDDKGTSDTSDDLHTLTFGTATTDKDCWHLTYTGNASTSGSNGVIGRYEQDQMSGKNNYNNNIYENGLYVGKTTKPRPFLRNGSLTGVEMWQDMKNVPAGNYKIVVDLTAYYRSGTNVQAAKVPTGVTFTVTNSAGTHVVEEPINAYQKKGASLNQNLARAELSRYTFEFNQPSNGTLGIRISVGELNSSYGDNREVSMENFKLYKIVEGYSPTDDTETNEEIESETTHLETTPVVNVTKHRPALRKRVLTMPDVCVPTYGGGGIGDPEIHGNSFGDKVPHTDRVSDAVKDQRTATPYYKYEDPNYVGYTNMFWDGFTIRHGFLYDESMCHGGGAGVNMYEGAHLKNCVVIDNYSAAQRIKGGGIFCDGATSTIEGCFVLNNTATRGSTDNPTDYKQVFSGGMFLYEGTCFNSLFAKNYSFGSAGGVGFCVGRFFNNTIAYNECDLVERGHKNGGAISIATSSNPNLFIANTIIYGNTGMAIRERYDQQININAVNPFINCYVQTDVAFTQDIYKKNINNFTTSGNYGIGNVLLDGVAPSASNTPFAADLDDGGNYTGNAGTLYDFRLTQENANCINTGTEDFTGSLKTVLKRKRNWSDAQVESQFIYQSVSAVQLPLNDVVYADRIQDCQIDMGAYEYDGTKETQPSFEMISFDPEHPDERELCAVYYVASSGKGLATASTPEDAACGNKMQKVLDAAGRLRGDLAKIKNGTFTQEGRFSTSNVQLTGAVQPTYECLYRQNGNNLFKRIDYGKTITVSGNTATETGTPSPQDMADIKHVIVKLAEGTYTPQRSSNNQVLKGYSEDIILEHSLMIPHGVELMGGYTSDGSDTDFMEAYRNVPNNKSTLSASVSNLQTGATGNVYHVVTFTNDLFTTTNGVLREDALNGLVEERAVVDGVSIEGGFANGTSDIDKDGGALVVPKYGHVRNCILQNNQAIANGGALYMQAGALVSGCILLDNSADMGGAIYVEEPTSSEIATFANRDMAYARIYNTTIIRNSADTRGGGVWFETNLRAKGVVMWQNSSNDMNNVAGSFDSQLEQTEANYPFAYCAVQTRRLPGVNNIEVKALSDEGVRWTTNSNDDMRWRGDKPTYSSQTEKDAYYYIHRLSALVRTGMPYNLYRTLKAEFPSLELRDIAGVARMAELFKDNDQDYTYLQSGILSPTYKDNDFLEIGARALDANTGYNPNNRTFTRLFVTTPDQINTTVASTLLDCDDPLYNQQGSSMANPFLKLTDAFDYIVKQRNRTDLAPDGREWGEVYADTRFEVFISGGNFYPYHNTSGVEGHARASTYVVPEGVTIIGGIDSDEYYCQKGYNFSLYQPMAGDDRLNYYASSDYQSNDRNTFIDENNNSFTINGITLLGGDDASTDNIMEHRKREDINGNNVFEPWEYAFTTTLSGNTPSGLENDGNIYHVITCFADPEHVGTLPIRYKTHNSSNEYSAFSNPATNDADALANEDDNSILQRTIIINGINITGGNAREFEAASINNLQNYYRGGGIMVDGNWRHVNLDSGLEYILDDQGNYTYAPEDTQHTTPLTQHITGYTDRYAADGKGLRDIPLIITNSQFQNNNAIQGGAIFTNGTLYVFNSSFVQNYAKGPTLNTTQSAGDITSAKSAVEYNGGGAVAVNGDFRCVNSIFANNEAMLGNHELPLELNAKGRLKQGFGGAIWGGENSNVRLLNCDIVMNQAVSYPSVYVNRWDYNNYAEGFDPNKFCANTIYWGNKTTGVTDSNFDYITDINDDVYSYRTQAEKEEALSYHEIQDNGGTLTQQQSDFLDMIHKRQPMFFCAYRPGFGPEPTMSNTSITLSGLPSFYGSNLNGTYDPHQLPFLGETTNYHNVFGANNNINITFANEGADGPNFLLPSTTPGKDGYNPSANWMPSRVNNLTDNGWSYLILTSDTPDDEIEFKKVGSSNHNQEGTPPEEYAGAPDNIVSGGPYNFYSWMLKQRFDLTLMPFGNQYYMKYKNTKMTDGEDKSMLRISSNPLTFDEAAAVIDIGVYEYQHRNLRINQSSEIDILWVTDLENTEEGNDGYTWLTPTSNLQAAIETLLRSRNDHAKQINIIGGEYKPSVILGDDKNFSLSFTIQTRLYNNAAFTPRTGADYGIRSLTFKGGYDKEIAGEAGYDFDKNIVKLSIDKRVGASDNQLNHIVNILDAEQYTTNVNSETNTRINTAHYTAIPIIFEGITFENNLAGGITTGSEQNTNLGGAAIYYREQYQFDPALNKKGTTLLKPPAKNTQYTTTIDGNTVYGLNWDWTQPSGEPKLTIRNCKFINNGKEVTDPTSAVKIEGGGGSALIVNSLFHNNEGNPVDAVNTTILNSTFALNKGHVTLSEQDELGTTYHSELHNSIIWRDDQAHNATASAPGTQWSGVTADANQRMTYNAITGLPGTHDTWENYGLSDTNADVLNGPNFMDPENGDFHLRPSKLIMNQGNDETYARIVWPTYNGVPDVTVGSETMTAYRALMRNIHPDQSTFETRTTAIRNGNTETYVTYDIVKANKDYALNYVNRLLGMHIDRGAYECTSFGQRIVYMNPNKTVTGNETGRNWETAYGQGQLQTAIDAATIYGGEGMAYVFAKGQSNTQTEETLTMHNGVNVYGGLAPTYTAQAMPTNPGEEDLNYTEKEVEAFVNKVEAERQGIAAKNATPTRIKGVSTVEESYDKGALVDGFIISNRNNTSTPASTPAVNIQAPNMVVRNSILTDNVMADNTPVASITNATSTSGSSLLYNSLIYGNTAGINTAGTLVNIDSNGNVLNCTIVKDNAAETTIGGTIANNVSNNIEADESASKAATFAPYLRNGANAYTIPASFTEHKPYWYQLHEHSTDINAGDDDGSTAKNGGNSIAATFPKFVNFDHDRDLLGNPRRIGGQIDNGCYETWRVDNNSSIEANATTNTKPDETKYVADVDDSSPEYNTTYMVPKADYWGNRYGGNFYPHRGSVVYVEEGASLVLKYDGAPEFTSANPVRPGYLLVKDGGSIFGQGNWLQAEYLAAERKYTGLQYALTAFPFPYDIRNVISVNYNSGTLTETSEAANIAGQTYDVESRSVWRYAFQPENSTLWTDISGDACKIAANAGWLLDLGSSKPTKTLRFTGWGESSGQYPYVENGNNKTITLTQHNSTPGGGSAQFTALEDMGWNLFGMPWLVSNFKTDTQTAGKYAMHIPHVFYTMNGDAQYTRMTGQIYSSQSWASGATFNLGDANFTQTAVIGAEEPLTFFTPMYANYTSSSPSPHYVGIYMEDDDLESMDVVSIFPEDDADEAMPYRLNNDGIKLGTPDETLPQLFVSNAAGTRLSLVSKAPEETDISLGYIAPKEGIYTIALPEPDAYSDYEGVWLTDHETGIVTNLLTDEYKLNANTKGENVVRLTIRFGSNSGSITTATTTGPYIYVKGRTLHADNLQEGDMVAVYNTAGALIDRTTANGYSYECKVEPGIYILKVNNTAKTLKAQ